MKKYLFAAAMVAAFAVSAHAGGLGGVGGAVGGAVGGLGGTVGGIGGAVSGAGRAAGGAVGGLAGAVGGIGGATGGLGSSVTAGVGATVSGGASGQAGNVVSNVAHFGTKATTSVSANVALSAAGDISDDVSRIDALDGVNAVSLVDVSTLTDAAADAQVGNALSQTTSDAAKIQNALASNANVMMAITAENPDFDISTVVSADVRANNELVVYTN